MTRHSPTSHRQTRAAGMTLVELLIALAITGIIGAALASMLAAVAHGTDQTRDLRDVAIRGKALSERITHVVRTSHGLIDGGADFIELQMSEDDGGEYDVLRIEHNEADNTLLRRFRPAGAVTWDDPETWARGVSDWVCTFDEPDPTDAALVSFRITFQVGAAGTIQHTAIGAASLRN